MDCYNDSNQMKICSIQDPQDHNPGYATSYEAKYGSPPPAHKGMMSRLFIPGRNEDLPLAHAQAYKAKYSFIKLGKGPKDPKFPKGSPQNP